MNKYFKYFKDGNKIKKESIFCFRKLGLDLVPRQGSHMVDPDTMSVIELYHVVSSTRSSH